VKVVLGKRVALLARAETFFGEKRPETVTFLPDNELDHGGSRVR